MGHEVDVTRRPDRDDGRLSFLVRVAEGTSSSEHEVTLAPADLRRLQRTGEDPESVVRRCFDFLLAREPKESILASFDVSVIGRYFPEFEREVGG